MRDVLPRLCYLRPSNQHRAECGEEAMKADPRGVLTGVHFIDGDHACCEGALAAGARFAAGYPITPSTEVVERFAARFPPWAAASFKWRTSFQPRLPCKAQSGAAQRPL